MTERLNVSIPKGSKTERYLLNRPNIPHWQLIEKLVSDHIETPQERLHRAYEEFTKQVYEICPQRRNEGAMELIWILIAKRILRIPDEEGHEVLLSHDFYDQLRNL